MLTPEVRIILHRMRQGFAPGEPERPTIQLNRLVPKLALGGVIVTGNGPDVEPLPEVRHPLFEFPTVIHCLLKVHAKHLLSDRRRGDCELDLKAARHRPGEAHQFDGVFPCDEV